jgi:SAM-dependent methyltransferase
MAEENPTEHLAAVARWLPDARVGVEIGAFVSPIPGLKPFYVDCFEEYAHQACLLDYLGTAGALPFHSDSLDYVATSHVLEHVANPLQALEEWGRVLRDGGIIYAVIPDRRFTWDRLRPAATFEHLRDDFQHGVGQSDPTHVQDFARGIVWSEYSPGKTEADRAAYEQVLAASTAAGLEINIHFHAFEPAVFADLIARLNASGLMAFTIEPLALLERFPASCPNGFLFVGRVRKPGLAAKLRSWKWRLAAARNRESVVRPDARKPQRRAATAGTTP